MNILYIGSSGALSLLPFKALLASQYAVSAVAVNSPITFDKKIIALENESLALAAQQHDIPIIDLSAPVTDVLLQCLQLSIDVILMACYNKRLPDEIIKLAAKGCYNLHPSLLPAYRGPEPIFWQMKQGSEVGVSWHRVIKDLDAGDVVAQKKVLLDDGASYAEINVQLAQTGAELMLPLLAGIVGESLKRVPQNPELASYYPYPTPQDFVIAVNESAQQAYNFMSATRVFSLPYLCQLERYQYHLAEVIDYDNNRSLDSVEVDRDKLNIPCNEGVLIATYTDKIPR